MKVIKYIETDTAGTVPLVDMPLMSDEEWNRIAIEDRNQNLKKYHELAISMLTLPDLTEAERKQWVRILKETGIEVEKWNIH